MSKGKRYHANIHRRSMQKKNRRHKGKREGNQRPDFPEAVPDAPDSSEQDQKETGLFNPFARQLAYQIHVARQGLNLPKQEKKYTHRRT